MTTKSKKTLLWYGIFITALTLNQSKAFTEDFIVKIFVHGLWIALVAVTYVYFKEKEWD